MDKARRLPVFTASNLDYSAAAKKPEPGDYTRKGLSGLGPNDMELWFADRVMASGQPSAKAWAVIQHGLNEMLLSPAVKRRIGIELLPSPDEDENAAVSMIGRYRQSLKPV